MKKSIIISITFVLVCQSIAFSQQVERISKIKEIYYKINNDVESNALYCNEFVLNKGKLPWPAVGIYQEKMQFFYDYNTQYGSYDLKKIVIKAEHSITKTYIEFLFNDSGNLIFYYYSFQRDHDGKLERRCYFYNNILIRLIENAKIIDKIDNKYNDYWTAIIKRADKHKNLFHSNEYFDTSDIKLLKDSD